MSAQAQQTPSQTRVIDPILSEHARGYRQAELIGRALFPFAFVGMYGGQVIEFDKSAFKLYNSRRAPGTATRRIRFGYEGKPYSIVPSALESVVPRELMRDASQVPGIDLGTRAVNTTLRSLNLEHEVRCAQIATNASNYDNDHKVNLTSTDVWSHEDSDPIGDIETGIEAIRSSVGVRPNTLVLPALAWRNVRNHPSIIHRAPDTEVRRVTLAMLREILNIPNIAIGDAIVAEDDNEFGDVWGTSAVLAYVGQGNGGVNANMEEPSYGYTYVIDGHPLVEQPYWDANAKSWVYGTSFDNSPVLSGMTAGYLMEGAGL